MTVDEVQRDLHYDAVEPALKQIRGAWKQLRVLELAARRDETRVPKYREYLERCVAQLPGASMAENDAVTAFLAWNDRYCERRAECDAIMQRRGGKDVEVWMERWFPQVHQRLMETIALSLDRPSRDVFARLAQVTNEYFDVCLHPPEPDPL